MKITTLIFSVMIVSWKIKWIKQISHLHPQTTIRISISHSSDITFLTHWNISLYAFQWRISPHDSPTWKWFEYNCYAKWNIKWIASRLNVKTEEWSDWNLHANYTHATLHIDLECSYRRIVSSYFLYAVAMWHSLCRDKHRWMLSIQRNVFHPLSWLLSLLLSMKASIFWCNHILENCGWIIKLLNHISMM